MIFNTVIFYKSIYTTILDHKKRRRRVLILATRCPIYIKNKITSNGPTKNPSDIVKGKGGYYKFL